MSFKNSGSLLTTREEVLKKIVKNRQTDWENYQTNNNLQIQNGALQLERAGVSDNFDDGNYDGWNVHSGNWAVQNGVLHQNAGSVNNTISHSLDIPANQATIWTWDWMQEAEFFGKTASIYYPSTNPGSGVASVSVAYQNSNSNYSIQLRTPNGVLARKPNNGRFTMVSTSVEYDGNDRWDLYINGSHIGGGSYTPSLDSEIFYLHYDYQGQFDNWEVTF